jgi:hypothetical protein
MEAVIGLIDIFLPGAPIGLPPAKICRIILHPMSTLKAYIVEITFDRIGILALTRRGSVIHAFIPHHASLNENALFILFRAKVTNVALPFHLPC